MFKLDAAFRIMETHGGTVSPVSYTHLEGALSLVKAAIAAQEGGSEGVYTVNKTFTAHVSGDYILYFSCKDVYKRQTWDLP